MASIADILIAKGNAAAEGAIQRGNIYADLIRNLSSIPGQVLQEQRQRDQDRMRQQLQQQQLQLGAQNLQQGQMALTAAQRDTDAQAILGQVPLGPDNMIDIPKLAELARAKDPALVPHVTALGQKINAGTAEYQTKQMQLEEARRNALGELGLQQLEQPNDLGSFQLIVAKGADAGLIPKDSTTTLLKNAVEQPGFIAQQAQQWIRGSKEARAATAAKVLMLKEGEQPFIQQQLPGGGVSLTPAPGVPVMPKPLTDAEYKQKIDKLRAKKLAADAKRGPLLTPGELDELAAYDQGKGDTATQLQERYIKIQQAKKLGQPVSPEDQAWADSYEKQRLMGPEATAAAAADRQARTIAEQNALQKRQQDFAIAQTGRKELTDKVEQPLLTALASAQTLRDTVAAAQGGNKIAGSLQALETTMAAIRAQGLNRINTAEIGVTANAGSLWDHIQSWFGSRVAGQPIPANIQQDMKDFASILEKAAYKKYSDAWEATTKRYGLKDEQKLPGPTASAPPPPPPTGASGPKVGDVVTVGGKKIKITAIHPDGTFDGTEVP